ncbi:hypothetical protein HGB07_07315 [Candidatus Roizmanbacteria bacterium]|nr:hypothetical protein [Candidatus Roizmanbacteria bacterium]
MFKAPEHDNNFVEMEKKWLSFWNDNGIVQNYRFCEDICLRCHFPATI